MPFRPESNCAERSGTRPAMATLLVRTPFAPSACRCRFPEGRYFREGSGRTRVLRTAIERSAVRYFWRGISNGDMLAGPALGRTLGQIDLGGAHAALYVVRFNCRIACRHLHGTCHFGGN